MNLIDIWIIKESKLTREVHDLSLACVAGSTVRTTPTLYDITPTTESKVL